jgi:hypothetical protein
VARKAPATEGDTGVRLPLIDALIGDALAEPTVQRVSANRADVIAEADALFASIILDSLPANPAGS